VTHPLIVKLNPSLITEAEHHHPIACDSESLADVGETEQLYSTQPSPRPVKWTTDSSRERHFNSTNRRVHSLPSRPSSTTSTWRQPPDFLPPRAPAHYQMRATAHHLTIVCANQCKGKKKKKDGEFEIDVGTRGTGTGTGTHRSCWTSMAIRGQERRRNVPSVRPPTVKPPRT
jgi:hypothetical protein